MNIATQLQKLHAGEIDFDRFAATTVTDWSRLGAKLHRQAGGALEVEDIRQVMLETTWQVLPLWNPELGPLSKFVIFHVMTRAKREIGKARTVNSHDTESGPRNVPIKVGPGLNYQESIDGLLNEEAVQDRVLEARQKIEKLKSRCRNERDIRMIEVFIESGSLDAAVSDSESAGDESSRRQIMRRLTKIAK